MGWRFRQSFKIIPGLRLNLSKSGLSASIGGAPFTVNVGPRGLMSTTSIPGAGVSYRQHFGYAPQTATPQTPGYLPTPGAEPSSLPPPSPSFPVLTQQIPEAPVEQIRSASTEFLTSESLKEVKRLMQMTFEEREDIRRQLQGAQPLKQQAVSRYESWENGFLFKRLFKDAFAKRRADAETESAKVAELEEQLRLTTVAAQIDISKEQAEPYFQMRDAFAAVCECAAIWDIKSRQATNRVRERTTAAVRLDRERITFSLDGCDLIQWEQKVPHLGNANGGDLFLYPGFILYRAARSAFSVIDYHDLKGNIDLCRFQEEDGIPNDSKVIGQAWAKANKDGSPDRRFASNHQIPIVAYGHLKLTTDGGLWEEFHFSDVDKAVRFVAALNTFEKSFGGSAAEAGNPS